MQTTLVITFTENDGSPLASAKSWLNVSRLWAAGHSLQKHLRQQEINLKSKVVTEITAYNVPAGIARSADALKALAPRLTKSPQLVELAERIGADLSKAATTDAVARAEAAIVDLGHRAGTAELSRDMAGRR